MGRDEVLDTYAAYLDACNRHAVDELTDFLAPHIVVNGEVKTPQEYAADLATLFLSFPDYRWRLLRAVVEDPWLSVHLEDSGTRSQPFMGAPGDGTRVRTDEFAMYRFDANGRIDCVEVTADNARLTQ